MTVADFADGAQLGAVEADLNYVAADLRINRRFVAPGIEVNTGRFETHRVRIANARPIRDRFTLDRNGFTLIDHRSAIRDFRDKAAVDNLYLKEVEGTVAQLTGATRAVVSGYVVRTADATEGGAARPPAADVHVDVFPNRAQRGAENAYRKAASNGPGFKRFIFSSLWRPFSAPPQDWPLALCDFPSVGDDDGVPNVLFIVDALPDQATRLREPWPGEDQQPAASIFRYNPAHRWWYFPDMTRDEFILLKFFDSDHSRAWRTPHTAFHDTSRTNTVTRESIEVRSYAFFE